MNTREYQVDAIESRLVTAVWTLRRLPDRERAYFNSDSAKWPEYKKEYPEGYDPKKGASKLKRPSAPSPLEIDDMQPALDLLLILPDVTDRRLVFWACYHQEGERMARIPWARVRSSLGTNLSRWTMKRRYDDALRWLAAALELRAA